MDKSAMSHDREGDTVMDRPAVETSTEEVPSEKKFAALTLRSGDRLRFFDFPDEIVKKLILTIGRYWTGLEVTRDKRCGMREVKLQGFPWLGRIPAPLKSDTSLPAVLMSIVFEDLHKLGWVLVQRTSLAKLEPMGEEVLFFRKEEATVRCDWMAIDTVHDDGLLLVGTPPQELNAILNVLPVQRFVPRPRFYDVKLRGTPWAYSVVRAMEEGTVLALRILSAVEGLGWTLYGSVKQNGTDTWHFCRQRTAAPTRTAERLIDVDSDGTLVEEDMFGGEPAPPYYSAV
ncbi:hypothetical protein F4780DRAFT_780840 [Xylariomycetidae sp. FL0641]|nr:hypothetical protein F4780DRAFT_780840 [Xylariomycetidae sp. FL0641]